MLESITGMLDKKKFIPLLGADKCIVCGLHANRASWFCKFHYLAKEARYALYDHDNPEKSTPEDTALFKEMTLERLYEFAKFVLENEETEKEILLPIQQANKKAKRLASSRNLPKSRIQEEQA